MKTRKKKPNRHACPPAVPKPPMGQRAVLEWIRQDMYSSSLIDFPVWWTVDVGLEGMGMPAIQVHVKAASRDKALVGVGVKLSSLLADGTSRVTTISASPTPIEKETKTGGQP